MSRMKEQEVQKRIKNLIRFLLGISLFLECVICPKQSRRPEAPSSITQGIKSGIKGPPPFIAAQKSGLIKRKTVTFILRYPLSSTRGSTRDRGNNHHYLRCLPCLHPNVRLENCQEGHFIPSAAPPSHHIPSLHQALIDIRKRVILSTPPSGISKSICLLCETDPPTLTIFQ